MRFIATCKMGVEALTAMELRKLSINVLAVEDARVTFEGGFDAMARACLWLRTAERVLMEVATFKAVTFSELFDGVSAVRWSDYLRRDTFIHVNGKSAKSTLFSVSDCQSITKKAIVENLKKAYNTSVLPESGNRVIVEVGILRDIVTVALDCCGAGLSRRGYRTYNVEAPLSETLGASIVLLSRFFSDTDLYDPMCGSGTIPIEAAMIAKNQAPGIHRDLAAEGWSFIDKCCFDRAREEANDSVRSYTAHIEGSDIDARSIELCKKHAKKAGVMLEWHVRPLREFSPRSEKGIIICNPPYGERMLDAGAAKKLYREMHDKFAPLDTYSKNIITSFAEFERVYGARADKRRKLSNGGMKCTLYSYFANKR